MSDDLPIPDFDHLTPATIGHRIRSLPLDEVTRLLEHERAHSARLPVIETLRSRVTQLEAGAEPSGGEQRESRAVDTPHGSPVDPSSAAPPGTPEQDTWGG